MKINRIILLLNEWNKQEKSNELFTKGNGRKTNAVGKYFSTYIVILPIIDCSFQI